jgi:hypothetical protein
VVEAINGAHENRVFLPGVPLSPSIRATSGFGELASCDAWLVVTPAQHMRAVLERAADCDKPLVLCAKGIEEKSGELLHRVAKEVCPKAEVAVLSGPTFAHEVAKGLPTAVTLAAQDSALAERLRDRIKQPTFRIYISDDLAGAEIGGAVKNVLAIACGVVEGKGLGQNARAALIGRGFAEMTRFGLAFGARRETLTGLSGLGDLVLTCSSTSSRRRRVHRAGPGPPCERERRRHADRRSGRCADCRPRRRRRRARRLAYPSATRRGRLEIDRDPLLFPIAEAGRVGPLLLAFGRRRRLDCLGFRYGWRGAQMSRGVEILRAFHEAKMSIRSLDAKR